MACFFQEHPKEQKKAIEGDCYTCTENHQNRFCTAFKEWDKVVKFQFFTVHERVSRVKVA